MRALRLSQGIASEVHRGVVRPRGSAREGEGSELLPHRRGRRPQPRPLPIAGDPRYVADGVLDAGICGRDWIVENGSDVVEVAELKYSKATSNPARWVVAVPEDSPVETAADLEGTLIASELVHTTERFFLDRGIQGVKVEYSWGATEVKASLPGVGAIVDITETGSSLRANKLREVATILESTTRLIANKDAWKDPIKRARIEDLALLLQGAIDGKKKVGLKMNLPTASVPELSAQLPSEKSRRCRRFWTRITAPWRWWWTREPRRTSCRWCDAWSHQHRDVSHQPFHSLMRRERRRRLDFLIL